MIFSALADVSAACQNYGQVLSCGIFPDPSKCYATGKGIEATLVGENSSVVLQIVNSGGQPCVETIQSLECELVSELSGTTTRGSMKRRGQSRYEIKYKPTVKGRHQLHVKVEGQHVRGSPFAIRVRAPILKLGTPIRTFHGMKEPCGVAINQRGEVIVAEYGANCVSVFSPGGKKLRAFSGFGSSRGQFIRLCGVTVDDEGNVLIVDANYHGIQKLRPVPCSI